MTRRRSRVALEAEVNGAKSSRQKAIALYQLALFHDNNARESDAIPFYEKALKAGLQSALKAKALAWLASSLHKTGESKSALTRIRQSRAIARTMKYGSLENYLYALEARIARSLAKPS